MKAKFWFLIIGLLLLFIYRANPSDRKYAFDYPIPTDIHYHAGFLVVRNGEIQDYSAPEYMKINPCSIDLHDPDIKLTEQQEQLEKAHLHDGVGDVVHVHRRNATWGDLFVNANMEIPEEAYAYQRGDIVESIKDRVIEEDESIIIVVGEKPYNMQEILSLEVSRDHIQAVAESSESCN